MRQSDSTTRLKYSFENLQDIRLAVQRRRLSKGIEELSHMSVPAPMCTDSSDEKPHDATWSTWSKFMPKLPGHIFREHKTLHTSSITRRKSDQASQKTDGSAQKDKGASTETGFSFVSDTERSELLRIRERVRLSVGNESDPQEMKVESNPQYATPNMKRRIRPSTNADEMDHKVFTSMYRSHTLGGKKSYVQEAFAKLQKMFGPEWIKIFHFEPYYHSVFVPIPYLVENLKGDYETPGKKNWFFGRTPKQDSELRMNKDFKLNQSFENFRLTGEDSEDPHNVMRSQRHLNVDPIHDVDEQSEIVSCFQVQKSVPSDDSKPDPRMFPYRKAKKTSIEDPSRILTPSFHGQNSDKEEKKPPSTRESLGKSLRAKPREQAKALDALESNPFSGRKRLIMPIMRSKKFVIWLHITNHPEPPFVHSYIRNLSHEEEQRLCKIVAQIPSRPDPLDPSISDEEYSERVKEWRGLLDAINEFVAPKPDTVAPVPKTTC